MRILAIGVPTLLTVCVAAQAFAAPATRPTNAACEALSIQRGAGPEGPGAHRRFMRDCLAGQIPEFAQVAPTPRETGRAQSYDRCEALSEQRGVGPAGPGRGAHDRFM